MKRTGAVLAVALVAASPAFACALQPADGTTVAGAHASVAWRTANGAALATARPLELLVTVCPAGTRLVRVDATMPEHRHGMNYRPTLTEAGEGRWRVQGMLLHMAGRWELRFDTESPAGRDSLRSSVTLR